MTQSDTLRIGIDATDAGVAGSERGGVYHYMLHLFRHLGATSPESELRLMFALPRRRHTASIREFVAAIGNARAVIRRCPVPARHLRRWRIPVDPFVGRIDVFHAPAHLGLRCLGSPVVLTVHDLSYLRDCGGTRAPEGLGSDERRRWEVRHGFFREMAEHIGDSIRDARRVIAVSKATRDDILRRFGVAEEKVRVVHLGLRDDVKRADGDARRAVTAAYGLDGPYWLYVGNLDPNKNLGTMLEGYARYRNCGGTRALAIAGHSAFFGTLLRNHARRLGLGEHVRFLGYVPDGDLAGLYSAASALLMPSPLEGFGLPALEAMACGTPVIAADGGSLPEVMGTAGLLVPWESAPRWADAMRSIEGDDRLRETLIGAGTARAREFSWRRTAQETLSVYVDAIRGAP